MSANPWGLPRIVFSLAQAVQRKTAIGDHACVSRDLWSPSGDGFKSSGTNFLLWATRLRTAGPRASIGRRTQATTLTIGVAS